MTELLYDSGEDEMSLESVHRILASDLAPDVYTYMQDIVFRDGTDRSITSGDTAPGLFTASMDLTFSEIGAGNILTFVAKSRSWATNTVYWPSNISGWESNAYGFSLTDEGMLRFSRNDCITEVSDFIVDIAMLEAGITYNITLTSHAQPLMLESGVSSSGDNMCIGRGSENFTITISCEEFSKTITASGFGLNGDEFAYMELGGENGPSGTISHLTIKTIPEPASALLSMLTLVSFTVRRRRK